MSTWRAPVVDEVRADGGVEQAMETPAPPGTPGADDDHRCVDRPGEMGQRPIRAAGRYRNSQRTSLRAIDSPPRPAASPGAAATPRRRTCPGPCRCVPRCHRGTRVRRPGRGPHRRSTGHIPAPGPAQRRSTAPPPAAPASLRDDAMVAEGRDARRMWLGNLLHRRPLLSDPTRRTLPSGQAGMARHWTRHVALRRCVVDFRPCVSESSARPGRWAASCVASWRSATSRLTRSVTSPRRGRRAGRCPGVRDEVVVEDIATADFAGLDVALFSAGGSTSKAVGAARAPRPAPSSSTTRRPGGWTREVPLVVSEVNPEDAGRRSPASSPTPTAPPWPPCRSSRRSTTQPASRRCRSTTFQAVSGSAGRRASRRSPRSCGRDRRPPRPRPRRLGIPPIRCRPLCRPHRLQRGAAGRQPRRRRRG